MKTFDPPKKHRENNPPSDDSPTGSGDYLALCTRQYPEARRVAVMSLLPGLGQLRNGEKSKGWLFLTVTASNILMLLVLASSNKLVPLLTQVSAIFNRQPNWDLATPLNTALVQSPAMIVYVGLIATFVAYAVKDAYDGAVERIRNRSRSRDTAIAKLTKRVVTLPEAASSSYLFHYAVIGGFCLAVILFISPVPPKTQVTQIDMLLDKPKPIPEPPKARKRDEPKVEKPKEVIKPKPVVVQKPQKVTPPRPTPVAVAVPTKDPTPLAVAPVESNTPPPTAAPDPTPAGGSGGSGDAGAGKGGGGGGDAEIDMGPYMRELQRRIKKAWWPPKGNESKRIKVSFKVAKDGSITRLRLANSSGVAIADDAALDAVNNAAPFARLPEGAGDDVDINFTFDYNVFGSK